MPDYYEILQVHPAAEPEVIRAAYRILARKYHPDHGGDGLRMIALNNAWDVLGDPTRRAAYDATRAGRTSRPVTAAPTYQTTPTPAPAGGSASAQDSPLASPPPGRPSGTVLDFGRYAGWSLGEIARYDMDYLQWLQRATFGRRLRAEIDALIVQRRGPGAHGPTSSEAWKGRR